MRKNQFNQNHQIGFPYTYSFLINFYKESFNSLFTFTAPFQSELFAVNSSTQKSIDSAITKYLFQINSKGRTIIGSGHLLVILRNDGHSFKSDHHFRSDGHF